MLVVSQSAEKGWCTVLILTSKLSSGAGTLAELPMPEPVHVAQYLEMFDKVTEGGELMYGTHYRLTLHLVCNDPHSQRVA